MASSSSFALDFLRRLLCARSVVGSAQRDAPGHLSALAEPEGKSPCIVARLMGLDAMPPPAEAPYAQPQPQQLLRPSRSASSVEGGRSPCGLGEDAAVRPSASALTEKQAYLRPENDMFLLLSFSPEERDSTTKKTGGEEAERRRRENGPGGARKQHRRAHRRKLQFGDEDDDESAGRRECNAQTSSPVSVLEARDYVHEESSTTTTSSSLEDVETSEEAHLYASEQQSSTRKLHTSFVQLDDMSPATSTTVHASRCSDRERRRNRRTVNSKSDVSTAPDASGIIWQPVCRLVEEDLKNTEWLTRHGADVVVAAEMGSEILDQLICEATVELVQLSSDDVVHALPLRPSPMLEKGSGKKTTSSWGYPCPRNIQARQGLQTTEHESTNAQSNSTT